MHGLHAMHSLQKRRIGERLRDRDGHGRRLLDKRHLAGSYDGHRGGLPDGLSEHGGVQCRVGGGRCARAHSARWVALRVEVHCVAMVGGGRKDFRGFEVQN